MLYCNICTLKGIIQVGSEFEYVNQKRLEKTTSNVNRTNYEAFKMHSNAFMESQFGQGEMNQGKKDLFFFKCVVNRMRGMSRHGGRTPTGK